MTITKEQAEAAYRRLTASYWTRWPYSSRRTRDDQDTKIGYILAMTDMAMVAFGLSFADAEERVSEDMADHVGSLG